MKPGQEWSLTNRITRGFALACALLSLVIVSFSYIYVRRSVSREIASLAREELEEMQAIFSARELASPEEFEEIAMELGGEHPANPFAWWVWSPVDKGMWHAVGDSELLEVPVSYRVREGLTQRVQTHLFWTVEDLTDELRMGLLIDASEQQRILARYAIAGLIGVGLATLLATLGGSLFARRIGRELDEVARSVRRVTDSSKSLELHTANAPTEIRQVAESLGVMLENIRSESEQARLITAGLAHELRAPIQNMLGEAEVGLLRERSPAEYQAILGNQLDELRELGLVIDNLVTLTSPGRRSVTRARERFDLGEEARLRLSREEVQARRGGVSIDMETLGELVIEGDREALILAVRNLVGNAIQWSQSGQVVSLSMTDRGNAVVVCVDDQGPGVPEEDRERIFEPFVTTRAAKGQRIGYGLGLALARSAVASHGGKLAVGPSEKGGACFRIELPKKPES